MLNSWLSLDNNSKLFLLLWTCYKKCANEKE